MEIIYFNSFRWNWNYSHGNKVFNFLFSPKCNLILIWMQLQLIRQILKHPEDNTCMALIFANQTESDILLREELEDAAANNPDRLRLWYTVDRPTDGKQLSLMTNLFLLMNLFVIY